MLASPATAQSVGTQLIDNKDNIMNPKNPFYLINRGVKQIVWSLGFCSLFVFAQSYALSLQNLQVNSALGEPLDAVIQVRAAPGEILNASCISTKAVEGGMPGIPGVRLSLSRQLSPGSIRLTTDRPVREPMSELLVNVRCDGAPNIERRFLIMLDPRGVSEERVLSQSTPQTVTPNTVTRIDLNDTSAVYAAAAAPIIRSSSSAVQVRASNRVATYSGQSIARGDRYVVRNGESLSIIASRIEGRDRGTVWSWAATIQSANPQAFINGNPNELIAGSSLSIPMSLAAGTRSLTAVADIPNPAASNRTYPTAQTANTAKPIAVSVTSNTVPSAVGGVMATQPTMVLSRSFSGVSRARLTQRNAGVVHQAPANLPTFGEAVNEPQPEQPAVEPEPIPAAPAQEQPVAAVVDTSTNQRRFSWLSALGGLALLGLAFLAGLLFASRRARRDLEEQVDARLNEQRYYERVRTNRRNVTESVLNGAGASGGIEVSETVRNDDDDMNSSLQAEHIELSSTEAKTDPNLADSLSDNNIELPADAELDLNIGRLETLTEVDLELLERDYAEQTTHDLEQIARAGSGNATELVRNELDLEFPEDVKMRRENEAGFDTMEFETNTEEGLDFDIGAEVSRTDDTLEGISLDLAEAGADLDAQLEAIKSAENEIDDALRAEQNLANKSFQDSAMRKDQDNGKEAGGLENAEDDVDFTATSTRDSEEFYHLEASSIMHVGEMDFEKELDDETNILRFRKRDRKTGTDDGSDA